MRTGKSVAPTAQHRVNTTARDIVIDKGSVRGKGIGKSIHKSAPDEVTIMSYS